MSTGARALAIGWRDRMPARPSSSLRRVGSALRRDRLAMGGLIVVVAVAAAALLAPVVAPYGPHDATPELRLAPIGTEGHLLGVDGQGRDVLSRLLWGGRTSIFIALAPVGVAAVLGLALGVIGGFYRNWLGGVVMRGVDMLFALPLVLLAIAIAAAIGPGLRTIVLSTAIVATPYIARVIFAATREVSSQPFIMAARAAGARDHQIILKHLLPNLMPPLIVYSTLNMAGMVLFSAGLSFLGLGLQPPSPDWGVMTSDGRSLLTVAPHVAILPGLALALVAIGLNLVGDGLRTALDPRLRVD